MLVQSDGALNLPLPMHIATMSGVRTWLA